MLCLHYTMAHNAVNHSEWVAPTFVIPKKDGTACTFYLCQQMYFATFEIKYLGYWITQDGIQPLSKKAEALQSIALPKNKKQLQRFLGMVNYYHDMRIQQSEVLAPLMHLTSANAKFEWTDIEQMAFNKIK